MTIRALLEEAIRRRQILRIRYRRRDGQEHPYLIAPWDFAFTAEGDEALTAFAYNRHEFRSFHLEAILEAGEVGVPFDPRLLYRELGRRPLQWRFPRDWPTDGDVE